MNGQVKQEKVKNANLLRVLKNRGTQQLFIGEASPNKQLTQAKQSLERHNQKTDNYRHEHMVDY
ncbi:MAG: hypothetical protein ABF418_07715 [Liquorilactobacillus sp.]